MKLKKVLSAWGIIEITRLLLFFIYFDSVERKWNETLKDWFKNRQKILFPEEVMGLSLKEYLKEAFNALRNLYPNVPDEDTDSTVDEVDEVEEVVSLMPDDCL